MNRRRRLVLLLLATCIGVASCSAGRPTVPTHHAHVDIDVHGDGSARADLYLGGPSGGPGTDAELRELGGTLQAAVFPQSRHTSVSIATNLGHPYPFVTAPDVFTPGRKAHFDIDTTALITVLRQLGFSGVSISLMLPDVPTSITATPAPSSHVAGAWNWEIDTATAAPRIAVALTPDSTAGWWWLGALTAVGIALLLGIAAARTRSRRRGFAAALVAGTLSAGSLFVHGDDVAVSGSALAAAQSLLPLAAILTAAVAAAVIWRTRTNAPGRSIKTPVPAVDVPTEEAVE